MGGYRKGKRKKLEQGMIQLVGYSEALLSKYFDSLCICICIGYQRPHDSDGLVLG
jgi:hypothetical protein